jgi:WD40 repeat protein
VRLPVRLSVLQAGRHSLLSPDGRLAALIGIKQIRVFDLEKGTELFQVPNMNNGVRALIFAGNDRLVTADKEKRVRVLEATTGKSLLDFDHGAPVEVLAASPDGRWLATLEHSIHAIDGFLEKDVIHVWDLNTGTRKQTLAARPGSWSMALQFAPDGKSLFASYARDLDQEWEVAKWDVATGQLVREFKGLQSVVLASNRDGSSLAAGSAKFSLVDALTGKPFSPSDRSDARAASVWLSPTGDRVIIVGYDSISTWATATGERSSSFELPKYNAEHPSRVQSADGRYAVTFGNATLMNLSKAKLMLWDVKAGRLHTLQPSAELVTACAFSPDSSLLAICSAAGRAVTVQIWDIQNGREVRAIEPEMASWPGGLYFSSDGKNLTVVGSRVVGYEIATGKKLLSWRLTPLPASGGRVAEGGAPAPQDEAAAWRRLTISPDGRLAACFLSGGWVDPPPAPRIALCDAQTGAVLRRWDDSGKESALGEDLLFSPDSRLLATSDGSDVHLWEAATGKKIRSYHGHRGEIEHLAFSADGRRLASASSDSTVLIWNVVVGSKTEPGGGRDLAAWWQALATDDPNQAYAAVWRLAEMPEGALGLFRKHLEPASEKRMKQVVADIEKLDNPAFSVRDKAIEDLKVVGPDALALLRQALNAKGSAEKSRRVELLIEELQKTPLSGDALAAVRALAALEYAGTAEARRFLQELAAGAADAWLTVEAKSSLARLAKLARADH